MPKSYEFNYCNRMKQIQDVMDENGNLPFSSYEKVTSLITIMSSFKTIYYRKGMGKDSFLIEGLELISDIDFEHSRPFKNDLGHPRIIWNIL